MTDEYRSIVNEAAAASKKPVVNMGQGFFGYNPPPFVIAAAKGALDRVDCNQYSPTKVRDWRREPVQSHSQSCDRPLIDRSNRADLG